MVVHSYAFFLIRDPASVPKARRRIRATVADWGIRLDDATGDALDLVTSELVTNAVRHTTGPMLTVAIYANPSMRRALVEVYDGSQAIPRARHAAPDAETGRGMFLVERLALAHGVERTERGKRVWAELALPERPLTRRQLIARPHRAVRALARRMSAPRRHRIHPPTLVGAHAH
ncbi:ATP-binding protein [Kitasatospora sp. NPDC008050]|uniref:ATP-binding protein n=1 Tax=Kitasatospora sp. NPDC008050 TaxID=3364021 RepID=UPI0036EBF8BF